MINNVDEDFNRIKDFLEEGRHKLDNPDFEENLMSKIFLENNYKAKVRNYLESALFCFVGGMALCIILIVWHLSRNNSIQFFYEIMGIICLFTLSVFSVLVIDNFLKLLNNYKTSN